MDTDKSSLSLMELFGYVQSFNNGTFLLPPILIFPTIILPLHKQIKNVNNQDVVTMLKNTPQVEDFVYNESDEDIEANFRQSLNRGTTTKKTRDEIKQSGISIRQSNGAENITDSIIDTNNITINSNISHIEDGTKDNITTTNHDPGNNGIYPSANYNNTSVDSLQLSKEIPGLELPLAGDNRWQNFTQNTNISVQINNSNTVLSSSDSTTEESRSTNEGPYSAAVYNNAMIDQLSITTNSYTNEELPLASPKSDRWRLLPSLEKMPSATGFKPLAGLYYDGFLHKPLITLPGFIPRKYYNL